MLKILTMLSIFTMLTIFTVLSIFNLLSDWEWLHGPEEASWAGDKRDPGQAASMVWSSSRINWWRWWWRH